MKNLKKVWLEILALIAFLSLYVIAWFPNLTTIGEPTVNALMINNFYMHQFVLVFALFPVFLALTKFLTYRSSEFMLISIVISFVSAIGGFFGGVVNYDEISSRMIFSQVSGLYALIFLAFSLVIFLVFLYYRGLGTIMENAKKQSIITKKKEDKLMAKDALPILFSMITVGAVLCLDKKQVKWFNARRITTHKEDIITKDITLYLEPFGSEVIKDLNKEGKLASFKAAVFSGEPYEIGKEGRLQNELAEELINILNKSYEKLK